MTVPPFSLGAIIAVIVIILAVILAIIGKMDVVTAGMFAGLGLARLC